MRQRNRAGGAGVAQHADVGEQRTQARLEIGQVIDGALIGRAGDDGFQRGAAAPEVGAAQGPDA